MAYIEKTIIAGGTHFQRNKVSPQDTVKRIFQEVRIGMNVERFNGEEMSC